MERKVQELEQEIYWQASPNKQKRLSNNEEMVEEINTLVKENVK